MTNYSNIVIYNNPNQDYRSGPNLFFSTDRILQIDKLMEKNYIINFMIHLVIEYKQ